MAVVSAVFKNGSNKCYTKSLHQYDKGQRLIFIGVELPDEFEVHFSTEKTGGIGTAHTATPEGVLIPDEYLATGDYIYAWVYLKDEYDGGTTTYTVVIPVIRRSATVSTTNGIKIKGYDVDEDHALFVVTE